MIEDEEPPVPAGSAPPSSTDDSPADPIVSGDATQAFSSSGGAMNAADLQRYIGRGLRAVFDDVAQQPVPDRFLELMKKLG